jgi:hypothetical protein
MSKYILKAEACVAMVFGSVCIWIPAAVWLIWSNLFCRIVASFFYCFWNILSGFAACFPTTFEKANAHGPTAQSQSALHTRDANQHPTPEMPISTPHQRCASSNS